MTFQMVMIVVSDSVCTYVVRKNLRVHVIKQNTSHAIVYYESYFTVMAAEILIVACNI